MAVESVQPQPLSPLEADEPAQVIRPPRWPVALVGLVFVLFTAYACFLALVRYELIHTSFFDLGTYVQLEYNIVNGRPFIWSHYPSNYLGDHFAIALLWPALLFWALPDARTLQLIAMLSICVGALLPGFLLLRERRSVVAPLLMLALIFNPLLHTALSEDFQAITMAAPCMALAFWGLHYRRYGWMTCGLLLTLLVREDMPIYVASFALYILLFRKGMRWLGLVLGMTAITWLVVITSWVMPIFTGGVYRHADQPLAMYDSLLALWQLVTQNSAAIPDLFFSGGLAQQVLLLLLPLAALPLFAGGYPLLWLPSVITLLLSHESSGFGIWHGWRLAPILPLLFGSTAVAISRFRGRWLALAVVVVLAGTAACFYLWSTYPGGGRFLLDRYQYSERTWFLREVVNRVPAGAAVAATDKIGGQLGAREHHLLFTAFSMENPPDLAIADDLLKDKFPLQTVEEFDALVERIRLDPQVKGVWYENGVYVFSFSELGLDAFPHNSGLTTAAYLQALTNLADGGQLPDGATVFVPAEAGEGAALREAAAAQGVELRSFADPATLVLAGAPEAKQVYLVDSARAEQIELVRYFGFHEVEEAKVTLEGSGRSVLVFTLEGPIKPAIERAFTGRVDGERRLSNGLRFWRWQGAVDRRGETTLPLATVWEAWSEPQQIGEDPDLCLAQHLVDGQQRDLAVTDRRLEDVRNLRQGDLLVTWGDIQLPEQVRPAAGQVKLDLFACWQREPARLLDATGSPIDTALFVGPFQVGALVGEGEQLSLASGAQLGDIIALESFQLAGEGEEGGVLRTFVQWRTQAAPAKELTVFLQLLDANGIVAQVDEQPGGGAYPTSRWQSGEVVRDYYDLPLAHGLTEGAYRLIAGLYTAADVKRLPVKDAAGQFAGDFVELGTLHVGANGELSFSPCQAPAGRQ